MFTGLSNMVFIKYNSKMMRITKVINFTVENMKDVFANEKDKNKEAEDKARRFRQFRYLMNGFQDADGNENNEEDLDMEEFMGPNPFWGLMGLGGTSNFSLVVRKFGYIKELDTMIIPMLSGMIVKITNLNRNPQASYTKKSIKAKIRSPVGGIMFSMDSTFLEDQYGIVDPLQRPFLSIGHSNSYSLVNPATMKLITSETKSPELQNIHPSVFCDYEDFTADTDEPNTFVLVGGDDVVKYNFKEQKTLGVLPHALIRDKIYYSTFQPFEQAKFSDQLLENENVYKEDIVVMGGNDHNTLYVFAVVETNSINFDGERSKIFECRSKLLTSGHESLANGEIVSAKVVKGGRAHNFRVSDLSQGE